MASTLSLGNINKILHQQADTKVSSQSRTYELSEVIQKQLKRMREYYNDYFSGAQVKVYFNDVLADVVAVAWNATQNKSPIFGFNSQTFDAIAKGTFIINGEFTIAFKETAYLHLINEQIKKRYFDVNTYNKNVEQLRTLPKDTQVFQLGANAAGRIPVVGGSKATTLDEFGNVLPEATSSKVVVSTNTIEELMGTEEDFEERANALEDAIWGISEFTNEKLIRADKLDESDKMDIYGIKYYPIGKGFDIIITYGNLENFTAEHTIKVLNDVHILGSAQSIDPNTGFVIENYVFIAKDIDRPIGNFKGFSYKFEQSKADATSFISTARTVNISLTDCDPNNLSYINEPVDLDSVGQAFQKLITESIDGRNTKVKLTIIAPSDWTEDGVGVTPSILNQPPNVRKQLIEYFANNLARRFKSRMSVAAFQYTINFNDGQDNSYNLVCEIE